MQYRISLVSYHWSHFPSQVISEVAAFTGEDLTGLGDTSVEAFMADNGLTEDEAGLHLLGASGFGGSLLKKG